QSCLLSRRTSLYRYDTDTWLITINRRVGLVDHLHGDAHDHSAANVTVLDQVVDDRLRLVDRDGKADAFIVGRRDLLGVDADNLAIGVDQRAAGVAGVDGSVGLDAVYRVAVGGGNRAVNRRNITYGYGTRQLQAARVADCDDLLADL